MADIFPRTVRRGPIEWGEILYEPEPEVARQDMDMDRAFRFFFLLNLSSLFVGGISFLIIEVTEDFLIMAVITISIFCLLLIPMHYSERAHMPFRIYQKGITKTKVPYLNSIRHIEDLIPFEKVISIKLDSNSKIEDIDGLIIRHLDQDGNEVEYRPLKIYTNTMRNGLQILYVLKQIVPEKIDKRMIESVGKDLFNEMVSKIEGNRYNLSDFEFMRVGSNVILMHLAIITFLGFFSGGFAYFFYYPERYYFLFYCLFILSLIGTITLSMAREVKDSILYKLAFDSILKDNRLELSLDWWERLHFKVRESIPLSSITHAEIRINFPKCTPFMEYFFQSGEQYNLPQSLTNKIVGLFGNKPDGVVIRNKTLDQEDKTTLVTWKRMSSLRYFSMYCGIITVLLVLLFYKLFQ